MEALDGLIDSLMFACDGAKRAHTQCTTDMPIACMVLEPMIGELRAMLDKVKEIKASEQLQMRILRMCRDNAHPGVNPGEVVLSPFSGIGSEGVGAIR